MSDVEKIVSLNAARRKAADEWAAQLEESGRMYQNARRRVELRRMARIAAGVSYVAAGALAALAWNYAATGRITGAAVSALIAAVSIALARQYGRDAE